MSKKNFYLLWYSPSKRRAIPPQIEVDFGQQPRLRIGQNIDSSMDSTMPKWATESRFRRRITAVTILTLISIWAVSLSSIQLGWVHYVGMSLVIVAALGLLNFTFRSLFDVSEEFLDERLFSLRNRYSFRSYQAIGLMILLMIAALNVSYLDPSRLWLPAISTYASLPYLFLGWQEKNFD